MTRRPEPSVAGNHSHEVSEWKALLDATVDAIIVIDHKGHVETHNSAAEAIFGYSADEVVGKNVSLLMPRAGEIHADAQPTFVGIVRDTTERKQSEEEVHQTRERLAQFGRLSTLGEMAASLAHELNRPLFNRAVSDIHSGLSAAYPIRAKR